MQAFDGHGLGVWLDRKDEHSRNYAYEGPVRSLRSVTHRAYGPITDQGDIGACVGFSDIDWLNYASCWHNRALPHGRRRYMDNEHGVEFYGYATRLDEWAGDFPPDDFGTSVLAGAKAMQRWGYIRSYRWAFTFEDFISAAQAQPVIVGTLWTSGMSDPNKSGLIRPTGEIVGGHAYTIRGVNFITERFRARNHWTESWGDEGDFYISFADMEWLLAENGEACIPALV